MKNNNNEEYLANRGVNRVARDQTGCPRWAILLSSQ